MRARAGWDDDEFGNGNHTLDRHRNCWWRIDYGELEPLLTQHFKVTGKPLIFVVNGATPKAKITYEAVVALSQHGTVAPVTLHHRTDYAASMIDGRTVMEVDPKGRSAAEVIELWKYMADRLEKNFRRTVFSAPGIAQMPMPSRAAGGGFGRRGVGQ